MFGPYRKKADAEPISEEEKTESIERQALEYFKRIEKVVSSKIDKEVRKVQEAESKNADKKCEYKKADEAFKEWRLVFLHRVIRGDSIEDADKTAKQAVKMIEDSKPVYPELDRAGLLGAGLYLTFEEKAKASSSYLFAKWKDLWEEEGEAPSPKEVARKVIRRLDLLEDLE